MISWWMGKNGERAKGNEDEEQEPPETPAPIFAARALKSAIWGTPAPPEDETIHEVKKTYRERNSEKGNGEGSGRRTHEEVPRKDGEKKKNLGLETKHVLELPKADPGSLSPTKPPGILLTPGIGTNRRKNVVFGNEVVDNEGKSAAKKAELKEMLSVTSLETSSRPTRKTALTRTLENSREQSRERKTPKSSEESGPRSSTSRPLLDLDSDGECKKIDLVEAEHRNPPRSSTKSSQEVKHGRSAQRNKIDADITMDLNEPFSQSGRFWKSEWEQYRVAAKEEMEKLLKYKQRATSYARKKDEDAIELTEKLKEEQSLVLKMEDQISKLQQRVVADGSDEESSELIKELAQQTALTVQYKAQVEEFRAAVEANDDLTNANKNQRTSPSADQALFDTQQELRKAKAQLREKPTSTEELGSLRQTLINAEKNTLKLQDENNKLTRDLLHAELRLEKHEERAEKRRATSEEHLKKKDEALQTLQKDYDKLKDQMKLQRQDSEHLLQKRHDQIVALRKELASAKRAKSDLKEFEVVMGKKVVEHNDVVSVLMKQIAQLKGSPTRSPNEQDAHLNQTEGKTPQPRSLVKSRSSQDLSTRIPTLNQSIARPSKSMAPFRPQHAVTPAGSPAVNLRSSHSALSEISHNPNADREPTAFHKSDLVKMTPLANRMEDLTLGDPMSPSMNLPSPEPFMPSITHRSRLERRPQDSPRPSIFNIAASPPKPAIVRSRSSDKMSTQKSINSLVEHLPDTTSGRPSKLNGANVAVIKARSVLPPERAAAAKARLEAKNAEKKKAQALSAENLR